MPTQQKRDRVKDIKDRLERSTIAMTTSYAGISVNEMTELRRAMRGGGVDFTVVKNTLLSLAADEAQKPQLKEIINGPTAIAVGYGDPAEAAKTLADYIRTRLSTLTIQGAIMGDGTPMFTDEVTRLASLPPKDQLIAMLLGQMQAPIAQLLTILNGPLQSLDNVLQGRVRQLEEAGPAPAPEPEAEASTTEASSEPPATAEAEAEAEASEEAPPTDEASPDASLETSSDEAAADEEPSAGPEEAAEPEADSEPAAEEPAADDPEDEAEADEESESE
ncbi:MAG: 50S ribosomal protein L10 [Chloroflexi bacterium]|nr:50S ribosomal protein L10 [Chloroflexota bacterium]